MYFKTRKYIQRFKTCFSVSEVGRKMISIAVISETQLFLLILHSISVQKLCGSDIGFSLGCIKILGPPSCLRTHDPPTSANFKKSYRHIPPALVIKASNTGAVLSSNWVFAQRSPMEIPPKPRVLSIQQVALQKLIPMPHCWRQYTSNQLNLERLG